MIDTKKLYQVFSILGTFSLAASIPWICLRAIRAVWLRRAYNALIGKVVVITGASSGLGEALAHEFYKLGCQVVLCARRRQELERVKSDLLVSHPTVPTLPPIIRPLDLEDLEALPQNINQILAITDHIDVLINNGGISHRSTVLETKIEVDKKIMNVNYFGAVALTKAALPHMTQRKSGHVVFVSSVQGLIAIPERSAYSASKHAIQGFADSLRAEIASDNVEVTVVSPGYIKTHLSNNALVGSGGTYGQMDSSTQSGYTPEYVAEEIVRAIIQGKKEIIICPILPKIAIFLRNHLPGLYFYVMARRAIKKCLKTN